MKKRPICTVLTLALVAPVPGCGQDIEERPAAETAQIQEKPGYAALLPNARQPMEGVVSGGQPSPEQLVAARDAGFRTVINLRTPGEPGTGRDDVEALGMDYVSIPIAGADGLTLENTQAFVAALEEAKKPVILHCSSGNRIGALMALKAFHLDSKSAEEALEIGKAAGLTRLEQAVREHLETAGE